MGCAVCCHTKIDTLAQGGLKLQQHYCTARVCAPSRASLLTGLKQGHANIRDNPFEIWQDQRFAVQR
ncbi:MAG: sulfatase-like hydrolase/transferase [Pirellulales bacterium]